MATDPDAALRDFGASLTQEQRAVLRQLHEDDDGTCMAHREGVDCCVDLITEDPSAHEPDDASADPWA